MYVYWRDLAACNGEDPEMFFRVYLERKALEICASCPVTRQCRNFADRIEYGVPDQYIHGVWAGETVKQRIARRSIRLLLFA